MGTKSFKLVCLFHFISILHINLVIRKYVKGPSVFKTNRKFSGWIELALANEVKVKHIVRNNLFN